MYFFLYIASEKVVRDKSINIQGNNILEISFSSRDIEIEVNIISEALSVLRVTVKRMSLSK